MRWRRDGAGEDFERPAGNLAPMLELRKRVSSERHDVDREGVGSLSPVRSDLPLNRERGV